MIAFQHFSRKDEIQERQHCQNCFTSLWKGPILKTNQKEKKIHQKGENSFLLKVLGNFQERQRW